MSAPKHTPGPWTVGPPDIHGLKILKSYGREDEHTIAADVERRNAALIAAAPEMADALEACDAAFVAWQVGQLPGRPDDILKLIVQVRVALKEAGRL